MDAKKSQSETVALTVLSFDIFFAIKTERMLQVMRQIVPLQLCVAKQSFRL